METILTKKLRDDFYRTSNLDEEYNNYFYSIAKYLPKKLVKYYEESYSGMEHNRFHDCGIENIEFIGASNIYRNVPDTIKLTLNLGGEIEYILEIIDPEYVETKFKRDKNLYSQNCLDEILDCQLGLSDKKNCLIYFYTASGFEFSAEFKKVKIQKFKLFQYVTIR